MSEKFVEYYTDVKKRKATLRGFLRKMTLNSLSAVISEQQLNKPRVQFVYIHHTFKDEEKNLDSLLTQLKKQHEFISYSEAVNKILSGNIDKPYISLSTDDGFKNNLRTAEILNRHKIKACFFVNPGIIGETDYNKIKEHCEKTLKMPPIEFLDWDDIAQLQQMGHEIGSQTMMHKNIAEQEANAARHDISQSYEVLKQRCGSVAHFAYPYGRFSDFDSAGRQAVFDAGFLSCASSVRGCHITDGAPINNQVLCIRRDHIVLDWNIKHILYFLSHNARNASLSNNYFPASLL